MQRDELAGETACAAPLTCCFQLLAAYPPPATARCSPPQRRVNAVLPGWIDTSGEPGSITPADHAWHPAGRVGRPEDVAELVLFLADGSRSGFITGQVGFSGGSVCIKGWCCSWRMAGAGSSRHQKASKCVWGC